MKNLKFLIKLILGKEIYITIDKHIDIKWFGKINAGFYVYEKHLNEKSVIYSVGVGEDISFDEELITKFNSKVYGFDPTPKSIKFIEDKKNLNSNFFMNPYGLYNFDGKIDFLLPSNSDHVSCTIGNLRAYEANEIEKVTVPVYTFDTILSKIGTQKIDILKLDIEGAEYEVLDDILNSKIEIDQICIEFHHRFKGVSKEKTKSAIKLLRSKGYLLVGISAQREEYTFLLKSVI